MAINDNLPAHSPQSTPGPEVEDLRRATIEMLASDPSIYHSMDYWSPVTGGHGKKFESGPDLADPFMASNNVDWQPPCEKAGLFSAPTWHHGEAVVGKITTPGYTGLVLNFQKNGDSSRPDVTMYTVIPNDPRFEGIMQKVEQDPALLLDVFSAVAPEEAAEFTVGVKLVSDKVNDLQPYARKALPLTPEAASDPPAIQAKSRSGFLRRLINRDL